jgi:hypothetical protein
MENPVTSEGMMSGVNWMRLNPQSIDFANAETSEVLPVPGRSSMSTWPCAMSEMITSSTGSRLPTMTVSILSAIRASVAAPCCAFVSSIM